MPLIGTTKQIKIGAQFYSIMDDYLDSDPIDFEPGMTSMFETLIEKDYCVFDIGSNTGCTSILFANNAAHVHAFEPSSSTFKYMTKNFDAAGLNNITAHNMGFGKEKKISEITFMPYNRAGGFVSDQLSADARHKTEQITIDTLDNFVIINSIKTIDFIKIDAEGYEQNILMGGEKTIQRFKPVIVLELNHWCLNAFQRITVPDFFDYLRNQFPIVYAFNEHIGQFANLRDISQQYMVMYEHIIHFKWMNLVVAFDEKPLSRFYQAYRAA